METKISMSQQALFEMVTTWPGGGGHTVKPDATAAEVRAMTRNYGLDHLAEATEAIGQFAQDGFEPGNWANLVGVNCGAALGEALLVRLGAGSQRAVLIDRPAGGQAVVEDVFEHLGLDTPEFFQPPKVSEIEPLVGSTLVFVSHGQNVNWQDAKAQAELEAQNHVVFDALARLTDPAAGVAFLSVEPGFGRNQSNAIANHWFGNRAIDAAFRCAPANRTHGKFIRKRAEYLALSPELAILSANWIEIRLAARSYQTSHGTRVLRFDPAPVVPTKRLIAGEIGPRITLSLDEADFAEAVYEGFLGEVAHAERLERLEIFGDESDDFEFATIGGA